MIKKCKHEFKFDGGPCIHCGKTVVELIDEVYSGIEESNEVTSRVLSNDPGPAPKLYINESSHPIYQFDEIKFIGSVSSVLSKLEPLSVNRILDYLNNRFYKSPKEIRKWKEFVKDKK